MKEGRTSCRFAPVQGQPVNTNGKLSPCYVKISEFHSSARRCFELLDNRAACPLIRESIGNQVGDRQAEDHRKADEESQPVFQSEFSLRSIHARNPE